MPDLFSPYTLKGVTLRNRIAMSPMTMYRSVDGLMNDFHVMLMGSRAAGGFGLVFPEQLAIMPDGRTSTSCAGIYDDSQIEGLSRSRRSSRTWVPCPPLSSGIPAARAVKPSLGRENVSCRPTIPMAGRFGGLQRSPMA